MHAPVRDRGAMLPIVLVVTVALSMSVIGIATYVGTDLQYGRVTVDRANRLAAADAVMNYGIDQLKLRNAGCLLGGNGPRSLPGLNSPVNGASTSVTCQRVVGGGIGDIQAWAAVMTGIGVPTSGSDSYLLSSQSGNSEDKILGGPVYMERVTTNSFLFGPTVKIKDGPLFYHDATCATPATAASLPSQLIFEPNLIYGPICASPENWTSPTVGADPVVPDLSGLPLNPATTTNGSCKVFSPGVYDAPPSLVGSVYFRSGDYYFLNVPFNVDTTVTAGYPDPAIVSALELPNSDCNAAMAADASTTNLGATFYLGGTSYISIQSQGSLEIMPRLHGANYVSIHALCSTTDPLTAAGCDQTGGPTGVPSLLTASNLQPTGLNPIVYTDSGNKKQLITHGLLYAPTGRLEFGNATNTAMQKIMGGLVVARLVLQSSASASNFEISVPTSPVNYTVLLVATATKNGTTTIRAVVDYRPYEDILDERLAISSWWVG